MKENGRNLKTGIIKISQTGYLKNVFEKFGMSACKPVTTPVDPNFKFDLKCTAKDDKTLKRKCRILMGCLM